MDNLNLQYVGDDPINHAPLQPEPEWAMTLPLAGEGLVVKSFDDPQTLRPRKPGNVFPFLLQYLDTVIAACCIESGLFFCKTTGTFIRSWNTLASDQYCLQSPTRSLRGYRKLASPASDSPLEAIVRHWL